MYNELVRGEEVNNIKKHLSIIQKDIDKIVEILNIDSNEVEIWEKTTKARIMTEKMKGMVGYLLHQYPPLFVNRNGGLEIGLEIKEAEYWQKRVSTERLEKLKIAYPILR